MGEVHKEIVEKFWNSPIDFDDPSEYDFDADKSIDANIKETISVILAEENFKADAASKYVFRIVASEHSTPLGLIEAIDESFADFGILQIDAHADLRNAYENFEQSHASIMFNVTKNCNNLSKLVQIGIRDIAQSEIDLIESSNGRIKTFFDWDLKEKAFNGVNWSTQVDEIISELPQNVYISFDIDGLIPSLCPNTGTPVAGGFQLEEITFLLFKLVESGRKIIGFDLNEVSPGESGEWDANVGARALWNLVCATEKSRRENA
jgi:agmatinase